MNFQFKQFTLQQDSEVFKFGTDAALLATWIKNKNSKHVLEIGTGTGVISLMMAQRNPKANYTGIDISKQAIELAQKNLSNFPIPSQIKFLKVSLQEFETKSNFDLIVSNPPFFENGTKSSAAVNLGARHTDTLSLFDLLENSKKLLSENGKISWIYPSRYLDQILKYCKELTLYPIEIVLVRSKIGKEVKRVLMTIQKKPGDCKREELIIEEQNRDYTPEVLTRFKPFYLHL